ncbi:hypothetical protein C8A05DRAFT_14529 [Staphylotrichum tortipilum]|uniref:O-methyltransferase C-terminal domain-containing protein n=1 Tax=Staphylotrichum tortipilum TaxID=2831512 RepID=A0AAN6MPA2_9PEZI|nr:hypothetical protein C8A05DRAFT_14529 [Staphylotrichum longicolle]
MGKIRFSSLFHSSSSSPSSVDSETKKANRRSFSALSSSLRHKDGETNGAAKPAKAQAPSPAEKKQSSTSRMVELAKRITTATEKLEAHMKANNLPMPDFDVDAPADFPALPEDVQKSRLEIIHATKELGLLAHGPRESFLDVLALSAINHYNLAKLVPISTPIPLTTLATLTPLDPINLARILRMAMTNGIFCEPSPGVIAHTAASRVLAEDENMQAWIGFNGEDIFPSAGHVLQALEAHPEATSLTRSGFQFAFGTVDKEPMFATFGKDPVRARRMGRAMASLTGGEGYEPAFFVDVEKGGYDFSELDKVGGTFVDIGGSHGFICVDLAERYKNMRFVVQDLQKTVDSAPKPLSADAQVAERIELVAHDFFAEQVTKDADVYFFRWIMHNYSTPYAVRIIKNLVPALKPGARILINDHCLLEPGRESPWDERVMRRMDVVMLTLLNAQERTEEEFRALFAAASDGFVFKGVTRPKGCRMSIIEAVWKPDEVEKKAEEVPAPVAAAESAETTAAPAAEVVAEPAPVATEKAVVETSVEPVNGEEAKAVEAK